MKQILPLLMIIGLISCNTETTTVDYLGQTEPQTTPVIFGEGVISIKGRFEHGISFTPDTRELAFGILDNNDFSGSIYYSRKDNNQWTTPEPFKPLASKSVYLPYFSPNGKSLLYTQSKTDTNFNYKDIWVINKENKTWKSPEKLKIPLNNEASVSNACMSLNGTIYFSSNINCIGVENCHTADLFYSGFENGQYQNVNEISTLNSQYDEESIFISPNENYMILSRYSSYENGPDLFISYRNIDGNWIEPTPLDSTINTSDWERRPFVSNDNKYLFFTKLSFNTTGLEEADIYWVSTQNVFKPYVFNPIDKQTIKIKKETDIAIPSDYFKDIDNNELDISFNSDSINWAKFDNEKMILSLSPNKVGEFNLIFTATDSFSNKTEGEVRIIVEE